MLLYSLGLKIEGGRCLVVGGGSVAERKVGSLLECGACVVVVSPEFTTDLEQFEAEGRIEAVRRKFETADVDGALLVIAATDVREVNEAVAGACRAKNIPVNVVDVPDLCTFYVPASVRRGGLQITVNTGGASPVLARQVREELEGRFGPEYAPFVELLRRLREQGQARIDDRAARYEAEKAFLASDALSLLAQGRHEEAKALVDECLARFVD